MKPGDLVRHHDHLGGIEDGELALVVKVYRGYPDGRDKYRRLCDIVWVGTATSVAQYDVGWFEVVK